MIVYSGVSSVEWSATFPGPWACDTEGANTIGRIRLYLSLLFWWKLLDFPWLLVALEDLTGKVQVVTALIAVFPLTFLCKFSK